MERKPEGLRKGMVLDPRHPRRPRRISRRKSRLGLHSLRNPQVCPRLRRAGGALLVACEISCFYPPLRLPASRQQIKGMTDQMQMSGLPAMELMIVPGSLAPLV